MQIELTEKLFGRRLGEWKRLVSESGLDTNEPIDRTVLLWDGDKLAATASRCGNILKLIAVNGLYRGENLTASVIGELRKDAFTAGYGNLFIYTKPQSLNLFSSLFFYPIAVTGDVALLEENRGGIESFINSLPRLNAKGKIGAVVMNANPFTLGHSYLVERAASECDGVYVFVLSEDKSEFSSRDRLEMVKRGTAHLKNVAVLETGPYLISSATFPTYFLKDRDNIDSAKCALDIEIFLRYFVPHFSITDRYVGTEPTSKLTRAYNESLKSNLMKRGVCVREVERLESGGVPISASAVRRYIREGQFEELSRLVPKTTSEYLLSIK